jgi:hypothetical protein
MRKRSALEAGGKHKIIWGSCLLASTSTAFQEQQKLPLEWISDNNIEFRPANLDAKPVED